MDYIIVGQGLAGSCLALRLMMHGRKIAVIDDGNQQAASRVAAGLFNPLTGKIPTLSWLAPELFGCLQRFYTDAERYTGASFFHPIPVYRPFVSVAEQNEWTLKAEDPALQAFISKIHYRPVFTDEVINPYGGLELKHCGYVDTVTFLDAVKNILMARQLFLNEYFYEEELFIAPDYVRYHNIEGTRMVLCTGTFSAALFSQVPIRPLKGEILKLKSEVVPKCLYNRGVYVVPGVWKAGATYSKTDQSPAVTLNARTELEQGLQALIRFPYEITGQNFGFRPTTPDRRPMLGRHPQHRHVFIFNGLGTKGVTLAPYFSAHLVDFMENDVPLNPLTDVQRYIIH